MKMFYYEITAKGRGEFPLDMLRYSGLHPLDAQTVAALHHERRETRELRFGMYAASPTAVDSCIERFWSFLWKARKTEMRRI